jgi:hypothetical protein
VKIIAFQLSLFCKNYRFSKTVLYIINRKIHGCLEIPDLFLVLNMISHLFRCAHSWDIMFNTLYLLTTLNISIQTVDCNNLQNSYVLRILCFWGEYDWVGRGWLVGGRGGVRKISSPLRGVLNIFRRFWGGAKFYGRILEYPPPSQYTYFMTGPLSLGFPGVSPLDVYTLVYTRF